MDALRLLSKFQLLFSDVAISGETASKIIDLLSDRCNCKGPTEEPKCKYAVTGKEKQIHTFAFKSAHRKSLKAKFNEFVHIWVQGIILFILVFIYTSRPFNHSFPDRYFVENVKNLLLKR
jgi:hypothetical protein